MVGQPAPQAGPFWQPMGLANSNLLHHQSIQIKEVDGDTNKDRGKFHSYNQQMPIGSRKPYNSAPRKSAKAGTKFPYEHLKTRDLTRVNTSFVVTCLRLVGGLILST